MILRRLSLYIIQVFLSISIFSQDGQIFTEQALFTGGEGGYACFRIPAIIKASNGDLLAFSEGRIFGCNDFGDVDIVLKRSMDNGQSWSPLEIVVDNAHLQAGNPAPVLDDMDREYDDGRVFLLFNMGIASEHDTRLGMGLRTVHHITSLDHGRTWSLPIEITTQVHKPLRPDIDSKYNYTDDWRSYALTPGHAIQLRNGLKAGRIFVPANHSAGPPQKAFLDYNTQAFYSDDHGQSWTLSDPIEIPGSNEAIAVQLASGDVMMNIRDQTGKSKKRIVGISKDYGQSWTKVYYDSTLISPVCQASLLDFPLNNEKQAILFSNPESHSGRYNMTVKMSIDDGVTWPIKRTVRSGSSAYSDLVLQSNNNIGLLYEHGNNGGIHFASFNLDWLVGDQDFSDKAWLQKALRPSVVQEEEISLSVPKISYTSSLFSDSIKVEVYQSYKSANVHFTTNGTTPTLKDPIVDGTLTIRSSCELKVLAYHPGLQKSKFNSASFTKVSSIQNDISEINLETDPSSKYPGMGGQSLFNLKSGTLNFQDQEWMGFDQDSIILSLSLDQRKSIQSIGIHALQDQGSWIFLPFKIILEADGYKEEFLIRKSSSKGDRLARFLQMPMKKKTPLKDFKIKIYSLPGIPEWHPGKGTTPWTFIDEIILEY